VAVASLTPMPSTAILTLQQAAEVSICNIFAN